VAAIETVYTLPLVAQMLGEDEDWLWEISCAMDPEDGCLGILGPNEEYTVAFTEEGIENLTDLIQIHKADPSLLTGPRLDS